MVEAEERCAEIDASHLGNCYYTSSKKARGLLRAGGEASKHVHIEWPHDHILVGPDKDRVFYKNLNMEQWAYGYTCIMENQTSYKVKDNMITHLKNVFQDSMSYGFRWAKGAHAEVLNEMELGKINWLDAHAISELRRTHTQKPMTMEEWQEKTMETKPQEMRDGGQGHAVRREGRTRRFSNEHSGKKTQYCICRNYNDDKCSHAGDHQQGNIIWRHACPGCKLNGHRQNECRRAKEHSKN
jgi:hypothetical protein